MHSKAASGLVGCWPDRITANGPEAVHATRLNHTMRSSVVGHLRPETDDRHARVRELQSYGDVPELNSTLHHAVKRKQASFCWFSQAHLSCPNKVDPIVW